MDIDGKKWVKFVAMQQDCAILIYDLNTMKGTVESYNKTMAQQFKTVQLQAWKIAPSSISLKEKKGQLFWDTLEKKERIKLLTWRQDFS